MPADVALVRCSDYQRENVGAAAARLFDLLGGIESLFRRGDRVLLKPNVLLGAPPERAVSTHPEVLRALIRALADLSCHVLVADQPGIMPAAEVHRAFEVSGIRAVCREEGVECRLFRTNGYVPVSLPGGKRLKEVMLPRDFQEVDHVVSVAKLKSHMQATYTGAIKNLFGAIPTMQRKKIHSLGRYVAFSEGVVDIFEAAQPALGIIDGIVGQEGKGPSQGRPRALGLLLGSTDLVALDRVASSLVGWSSLRIHHIDDAAARGLGVGDLSRISIVGESFEEMRVDFRPPPTQFRNPPRFLMNALYNFWSLKPAVVRERCTACGSCVAACPTAAITLDEVPKAFIDYGKCIECFCCHEMCAYEAITERPSALRRVLDGVRRVAKRKK